MLNSSRLQTWWTCCLYQQWTKTRAHGLKYDHIYMKSIFNNHYKTADTGDPWEGFVAMVLYSHWLTHSRNVIRALKTRVLRKSSLRPRTVMDMRFTIGSAETKITTIKRRHRQSSSSQSRLCRRFHTNLAPAYLHTGLIQHPLKEIRHKWSSAWRIFLLHHHFL